jgi:potassium-transporting ATPase KdpC subunit
MFAQLRAAVLIFLVLTVLTGVAYPLLVMAIAQVAFNHQANGSLIVRDGKVVGSELIGQAFDNPEYFWSRPSATAPAYNGAASTGSNYGPTNQAQIDAVKGRVAAAREANPDQIAPVPIDLVTVSASGLDPHISPAAADFQIARVAKARGLPEAKVRELVSANTESRTFGVLGEPRVNVLKLNLALDAM